MFRGFDGAKLNRVKSDDKKISSGIEPIMSNEHDDPLKSFNSRISALFASHKVLMGLVEDSSAKLLQTALALSKYLTALYAATFLFLLSSHDSIVSLSGSKGAVLWSAIIVLFCLATEAMRTIGLNTKVGMKSFIEDFFKQIADGFEDLDEQGKKDFPIFMDQLSETFVKSAAKQSIPLEFTFFQIIFRRDEISKNVSENVESKISDALKNYFAVVSGAREHMFDSAKKLGELVGKEVGDNIVKAILSGLTFCLYTFALAIPLIVGLINNLSTLFLWVILVYQFVMRLF